jgi:gluconate 2-dehydrogenase gamma chain
MSDKCKAESAADRRDFLKLVGVAARATVSSLSLSKAASAETSAAHKAHNPVTAAGSRAIRAGYEFFNTNESAFIESAVDTLIPADSVGPGAAELGVGTYIDRQMAGGYGKGDRLYLEGPFGEGTAQQGYQLAMTPSELIRAGIADVNDYTQRRYKKSFAALSAEDRLRVMLDLDGKIVSLPSLPTETFFGLLLQLTIEGYLADSNYGGNKAKASWKMIGFPGASAMYMDKIEPFVNKPYTAVPMSVQDLV